MQVHGWCVSRHDGVGKIRVVVVRTLRFLIVSRLAGFGLSSSPDARDIEIAVWRHQLASRYSNIWAVHCGDHPVPMLSISILLEVFR